MWFTRVAHPCRLPSWSVAYIHRAMKGNPMPFEVAIEKRLAILRDAGMSLATVRKHMADKPSTLSPGTLCVVLCWLPRGEPHAWRCGSTAELTADPRLLPSGHTPCAEQVSRS